MAPEKSSPAKKTAKLVQYCACEKNWCPVCSLPRCKPIVESNWVDGTLSSTYKRDYDEKRGSPGEQPELAHKDKLLVPSTASLDPNSIYKQDYGPKQVKPWRRGKDDSVMPNRRFDGKSTYNTYHTGKRGLPADPRPRAPELESAPFYGISTNKADFKAWGTQQPHQRNGNLPMVQIPFQGSSTYKDDFVKKDIPDRVPRAPHVLLQSKNDPAYTTYGVDYVERPFHIPAGSCCDNPHHPSQHIHLPKPVAGTTWTGNTTGRRYRA